MPPYPPLGPPYCAAANPPMYAYAALVSNAAATTVMEIVIAIIFQVFVFNSPLYTSIGMRGYRSWLKQ